MPRIAAISLARLSLRNISKKRLLQLINLIIFISLFAVTAAIISLVFEKIIQRLINGIIFVLRQNLMKKKYLLDKQI
jgi:hypothetical protein